MSSIIFESYAFAGIGLFKWSYISNLNVYYMQICMILRFTTFISSLSATIHHRPLTSLSGGSSGSGDILSRDISSQDIYCPGTICRFWSLFWRWSWVFIGATFCPGGVLQGATFCPGTNFLATNELPVNKSQLVGSFWWFSVVLGVVLTRTIQYWPKNTKYWPVPPNIDPVPPSTDQYHPIMTQYHQVLTSTEQTMTQYHQVLTSTTNTDQYLPIMTQYHQVLNSTTQ